MLALTLDCLLSVMARLLLLCFITDAMFWAEAQGNPPRLTVEPSVISETQNVTLTCQAPVHEPHCHFQFDKQYYKPPPECQTVLSGTELLSMVKKRTPTKITVTCFYDDTGYPNYRSDHSNEIIITIALAPPSLKVNPSVISETDDVKLRCRPPRSVSSNLCYFYATSGQTWENTNCVQTVRGSDLLTVNQSPPAEVQILCYYVVNSGREVSTSPYSEKISVTVQERTENKRPDPQQLTKPEISFLYLDEEVLIDCSVPQSATASKCDLYFGESTLPFKTKTMVSSRCQFFVPVNDFRTNLHRVQTKDVSCDYTLLKGRRSPRSDGRNSRDFISKYFANLPTLASVFPAKTTTRPNHVTRSDSKTSTSVTTASVVPVKATTRSNHVTGSSTKKSSSGEEAGSETEADSSVIHPHVITVSLDTRKNTTTPSHVTQSDSKTSTSVDETKQTPGEDAGSETEADSSVVATQSLVTTALIDQVKTTPSHDKGKNPLLITVTVCGLLLGIVIVVLANFCTKRRNANNGSRGKVVEYLNTENLAMNPLRHKAVAKDEDQTYTLITSVPGVTCPIGSVNDEGHQSLTGNMCDPYHLYETIPDLKEATSGTVENVLYCSLEEKVHTAR